MPTITKISLQKDKSRANIYLDGKFSFGLDLENLFKLNLKVEQELSQEEIKKIKSKGDYAKVLAKALNYATLRPRSEKELKDWFWRKKVDDPTQKKILKKLNKLELLDDMKFAKWWVFQRQEFKPRSAKALKYELMQKGIDKKIIDKVLQEDKIDELTIAKNLVRKNKYKWQRFDEKKRKEKLIGFLQRKGFNWPIIDSVLKNQ